MNLKSILIGWLESSDIDYMDSRPFIDVSFAIEVSGTPRQVIPTINRGYREFIKGFNISVLVGVPGERKYYYYLPVMTKDDQEQAHEHLLKLVKQTKISEKGYQKVCDTIDEIISHL